MGRPGHQTQELYLRLPCSQALCLKFPSIPSENSQTPALPHINGCCATHSCRQPEQLEEAKFRHFLCPPLHCDGVPQVCTQVTSRGTLSSSSHEIKSKTSQPNLHLSSQQGLDLWGKKPTPLKPDFPAALVLKDTSNCHLCCPSHLGHGTLSLSFQVSPRPVSLSTRHRFPHLHLTSKL